MKKLLSIVLLIASTSAFAYTEQTQPQQQCNTYCTDIAGSNTCNTVCTQ